MDLRVLWVLTGRGAGGCARSRRLPHAPGPGPARGAASALIWRLYPPG